MTHVELTRRAEKDLKQLDKPVRRRIVEALRAQLMAEPPPDNADVKPLVGAEPWLSLRVGTYRILYRPLTDDELKNVARADDGTEFEPEHDAGKPEAGHLVDRIVHRRDLDRAVGTL